MTIPRNKPRRGLQDILTPSSLVTETSNPQRKFMKLAILAMEKVRRGKERAGAQYRIDDIDERMAEIETETKDLLQVCNAGGSSKLSETPTLEGKASPRRAKGGFTFKY